MAQVMACLLTAKKHYLTQRRFITSMTSSNGNVSALLAFCEGNPSGTGEFPSQRPVTLSFNGVFYLRLKKRLSKQLRRWWFETPSRSLWRHCNTSSTGLYVTHLRTILQEERFYKKCWWIYQKMEGFIAAAYHTFRVRALNSLRPICLAGFKWTHLADDISNTFQRDFYWNLIEVSS